MILNGTGDNLQAFMAGAAATTNPSFFVTYADINSTTSALTPDSAGGALNGTTDVNLVSGVAGAKRMIKNLAICNIDSATVVVTVQFEDGADRVIQHAISLAVGKTLYWSLETGWVLQPSDPLAFLGATVTRTAVQTLTTGVSTAMAWTAEDYDDGDWHDNSTNNTRLTVPVGVTRVILTANVRFASNSTGRRSIFFKKNDTTFFVAQGFDASATSNTDASLTAMADTVGGDFFETYVFQDSGGDLDIAATSILPFFSIVATGPR